MYIFNDLPGRGQPLDPRDAETLGAEGTDRVVALLGLDAPGAATPLHALPGLARELGIGALHVKDEGQRLGLGSFKALGGAYAVRVLVLEEAARQLGRPVGPEELGSEAVRAVAAGMTFACATDGNHGRSVAKGAQEVGARSVIFVHAGVSDGRVAAIARFGARMVRVEGTYDESVAEAARVADIEGWTVVSDTSWPGYEYIPGLVMQGYTAIVREALAELPAPPTHVFLQAGVGGIAAAVAASLALALGKQRPEVTVVDPARAACFYESARVGKRVKVEESEPTVMAMLDCYEPSMIAFRILERLAQGFMIVEEEVAPEVMRRLADPVAGDPAIVSGESGGVGIAGLLTVLRAPEVAARMGIGPEARVLVINTEGATDPDLYAAIIGRRPEAVAAGLPA